MPLSPDSSLVCNENLLPVGARSHGLEFDVEIEMGEGLNVLLWPVAEVHEAQHGVLPDIHLSPCEVSVLDYIA